MAKLARERAAMANPLHQPRQPGGSPHSGISSFEGDGEHSSKANRSWQQSVYFSSCLVQPLEALPALTVLFVSRSPVVKAVIQQTLHVLRDLVASISGESTKSRQICYQSLQESVQVSLSIFPVFIQQPGQSLSHPPSLLRHNIEPEMKVSKIRFRKTMTFRKDHISIIVFKPCLDFGLTNVFFFSEVTDEMLAFFLTLFQALRVQMGVAFTGQIIHTFLSMFTRLVLMIINVFIDCY